MWRKAMSHIVHGAQPPPAAAAYQKMRNKPTSSRMTGERRALAVLAVHHQNGSGADEAQDGLQLVRSRQFVAEKVIEHRGAVIEQMADGTIAAWGLHEGGRRVLRYALACARELETSRAGLCLDLDAGIANVWKASDGSVLLVSGPIMNEARSRANDRTRQGLDLGGAVRAVLNGTAAGGAPSGIISMLATQRKFAIAVPDLLICRCLATLGMPLDAAAVAAVLGLTRSEVRRALSRLLNRGIATTTDSRCYRLANRGLRHQLAATILPCDKARWAADYAHHLADVHGDLADAETARRIAHFFELGKQWPLAFVWWRRTAAWAARHSQPREAQSALERASRLIDKAGTADDHLEVLSALASLLGASRGNAAPEVQRTYQACLEIGAGSDGGRHFDVLFGLQASYLVRGHIRNASAVSAKLIECATRTASSLRSPAHRLVGLTLFLDAQLAGAIGHYRSALLHYEDDPDEGDRFRHGSDQKAVALAGLAWAEAVSNSVHASQVSAGEALSRAQRLAHPHTTAHVTCVLATRAQLLGQDDLAAALATEAYEVARRHGLNYWRAWAEVVLGWHLAKSRPQRGLGQVENGMSDYLATGALQAMPYILLLKADAEMMAGQLAKAGVTLARAERYTRPGAVTLYRAEVLRAASRVALAAQGREAAARLARKAYRTAAAQFADLFCTTAVTELAAIASDGQADLDSVASAVKQRLL